MLNLLEAEYLYRLHACIQYSSVGLTRLLYILTMVILSLDIMSFNHTKCKIAFLTAKIHCFEGFKSFDIR